jgi:hypothetical protein
MELIKRDLGVGRWVLTEQDSGVAIFDVAWSDSGYRFYVVSQDQTRHCAGFKAKELKTK